MTLLVVDVYKEKKERSPGDAAKLKSADPSAFLIRADGKPLDYSGCLSPPSIVRHAEDRTRGLLGGRYEEARLAKISGCVADSVLESYQNLPNPNVTYVDRLFENSLRTCQQPSQSPGQQASQQPQPVEQPGTADSAQPAASTEPDEKSLPEDLDEAAKKAKEKLKKLGGLLRKKK